jgi:hypothetical protein
LNPDVTEMILTVLCCYFTALIQRRMETTAFLDGSYHFKNGNMSFVHISDLRVGSLKPLATMHPMYGTGLI